MLGQAGQKPGAVHHRYGCRPVFLETFAESQRHRGTCCKAANWTNIGQNTGRREKSRFHHQTIPIKDGWPNPVCKDFADVPRT